MRGMFLVGLLFAGCSKAPSMPPPPPTVASRPQGALRLIYELQEKCAKDARDWYANSWKDPKGGNREVDSYSNHFNARLGRCYAVVTGTSFLSAKKSGAQFTLTQMTLVDVLENRNFGAFDQTSNQSLPYTCEVDGKSCHSIDEWNGLTKPYMEQ